MRRSKHVLGLALLVGASAAASASAQAPARPPLLRGPVHPAGLLAPADADAIVRVSVAPLRGEPRHGAEQVDQVLLGTALRVLERKGGWERVRTPYGYEGWLTAGSTSALVAGAARWTPTHLFAQRTGEALEQPADDAAPVIDLVLGVPLRVERQVSSGFAELRLPDGRTAWMRASSLVPLAKEGEVAPSADGVIALARSLRGLPYLWGGNSAKGFDCSGYTQTVFRLNGVALPRDASPQSTCGEDIAWQAGFEAVRPGDLLFFGSKRERITHVAISLGGARFIHCATDVHEASLDPRDPDHEPERRSSLQAIRRVLPAGGARR
ncbi:MAG: C40 family peptidase [Planctomycetes bacterium]|nr:C40 family peptidase [Planctomycetota bacterium]